MGDEIQKSNSSNQLVIIVVLLACTVVAIILMAGIAGYFVLRANHLQRRHMRDRERALAIELQAQIDAERNIRMGLELAAQQAEEGQKAIQALAQANREITIDIQKDGQIHIDGQPIDPDQLVGRAMLAIGILDVENAMVLVRADKDCPLGTVHDVIQACQEIGVTRFQISTGDGDPSLPESSDRPLDIEN